MPEYIALMHNDATSPERDADWDAYIQTLNEVGAFRGGSVIGAGQAFRKAGAAAPVMTHINGFIRIEARDMPSARALLNGNPTYEAGGTVEIRELPST